MQESKNKAVNSFRSSKNYFFLFNLNSCKSRARKSDIWLWGISGIEFEIYKSQLSYFNPQFPLSGRMHLLESTIIFNVSSYFYFGKILSSLSCTLSTFLFLNDSFLMACECYGY